MHRDFVKWENEEQNKHLYEEKVSPTCSKNCMKKKMKSLGT